MKIKNRFALLPILLVMLSGCGANYYSIHRQDHLDSDKSTVIEVDAKQRFLLSNVITKTTAAKPATPATAATADTAAIEAKPATPSTTEIIRRFCAEPSPDVFSVLSQASSGGASFGQTADQSVNVALQLAFSSSETGSTISRTQTINMLKEMMYRTCERYLNGQISDFEYPIIAARDQRIMTSILAIEQLTGVVLPKPVVIAATGSASTGQSTNDAIRILDDANKNVAEKKSALETAQKEFVEIDKPAGSCKTLMAKKADEVTADEDKTKLTNCNEKKGNIDKAANELNDAKAHYDAIASLAGKPGSSSATTGGALLSSSSATEIDKQIEQARSESIHDVAAVVNNIVSMSFNQADETSFFCYSALRGDVNSALSKPCVDFLLAKVESETDRLRLETDETIKQINGYRKSSFEKFWDKVKKDSDLVDADKLKARIDKKFLPDSTAGPLKRKLSNMKQATKKDELWAIFNLIEIPAIDKLLED